MRKKVGIIKRVLCIGLVFLLSINSFAAIVGDDDGSAFITKAEFDALKLDFKTQIDTYSQSIDSKIDGAIASYLAGIKLSTEEELYLVTDDLLGLKFCSYLPLELESKNVVGDEAEDTWSNWSKYKGAGETTKVFDYNFYGINEKASKISLDSGQSAPTSGLWLDTPKGNCRGIHPSKLDKSGTGGTVSGIQFGFGASWINPIGAAGTGKAGKAHKVVMYLKFCPAYYLGNGEYADWVPVENWVLADYTKTNWTDEDKGYTPIVNFSSQNDINELLLEKVGVGWQWHYPNTQPDYNHQVKFVKDPTKPWDLQNQLTDRSIINSSTVYEAGCGTWVTNMHNTFILGIKFAEDKYLMIENAAFFMGPGGFVFADCTPGDGVNESLKGDVWGSLAYAKVVGPMNKPAIDLSDYQLDGGSKDYFFNTYGFTSDPTNGIIADDVSKGNYDLGFVDGLHPATLPPDAPIVREPWYRDSNQTFFISQTGYDQTKGITNNILPRGVDECIKMPSPIDYRKARTLYNARLYKNSGIKTKQGEAVPFFNSENNCTTKVSLKCADKNLNNANVKIYITTNPTLNQSNAAVGEVNGEMKILWGISPDANGRLTFEIKDSETKRYYISLSPNESYTDKFRVEEPDYVMLEEAKIISKKID